jgi:hypothetical protein
MKKSILLLFILFFGLYCFKIIADSLEDEHFLISQIEEGRYSVIYVEAEGESQEEAKRKAVKKAAAVTYDNHYRYFSIESEQTVMVRYSPPSEEPPLDHYEELIADHRGYVITSSSLERSEFYPGMKIIFQCYTNNPPNGAIDSCSLIDCP